MLLLYSAIFLTFLSPKPEILYSFHLLPCAPWYLCSPPLPRCHEDWHITLCVCPPLSHLMLISFPPFLLLFSHRVQLFVTPWTAAHQASLSLLISLMRRVMSIELVMPSNHLILCLPCPPAFNLSQHQGLFQWKDLFTSGGQSIGASALVLPMSIQGWFPLRLTALISFPPYICANPTSFLKAQSKCVLSHRVFLHPVRECWQWLPCACHTVMNKMVPNLEQCNSWMNEADKSADDSIWCCPAFFSFFH